MHPNLSLLLTVTRRFSAKAWLPGHVNLLRCRAPTPRYLHASERCPTEVRRGSSEDGSAASNNDHDVQANLSAAKPARGRPLDDHRWTRRRQLMLKDWAMSERTMEEIVLQAAEKDSTDEDILACAYSR
jgi:hypothetical protein